MFKQLRAGQVRPWVRRLEVAPDPAALYEALGQPKPAILLESAPVEHALARQSILIVRTSVEMRCTGRRVALTARSKNGERALTHICAQLPGARTLSPQRAEIDFGPVPSELDTDRARILASSPLDALRAATWRFQVLGDPGPLSVLSAGCFAYDLVDAFERLPSPAKEDETYPDFLFWLAEELVIIDHRSRTTRAISLIFGGEGVTDVAHHEASERLQALAQQVLDCARAPEPSALDTVRGGADVEGVTPSLTDAQFAAQVEALKAHIRAGEVFQIVPSRSFQTKIHDPLRTYMELRKRNPSPYMFYVAAEDHVLFGASPETSVEVRKERGVMRVRVRPIAGTRGRGADPDQDDRLEAELRLDEKERAEHMMLVDLARNDVARVCVSGTRSLERLMGVDRYAKVMHLVSCVVGTLDPELDALHAYQAALNMGTLVGAPKLRAAELLRAVEPSRRGPYGGAVGYVSASGEMDTAIVIRSALVRGDTAKVQAGAGVVFDSDPQLEAEETIKKATSVLLAIAAQRGEEGR